RPSHAAHAPARQPLVGSDHSGPATARRRPGPRPDLAGGLAGGARPAHAGPHSGQLLLLRAQRRPRVHGRHVVPRKHRPERPAGRRWPLVAAHDPRALADVAAPDHRPPRPRPLLHHRPRGRDEPVPGLNHPARLMGKAPLARAVLLLQDIEAARQRIQPHVHRTPMRQSVQLGKVLGCQVWLKFENLQRTGSFKIRGAMNKILTLTEAERKSGVVAASAGNHAQGVALAATTMGVKSTVVMPVTATLQKVEATRNYGAEVVLSGAS